MKLLVSALLTALSLGLMTSALAADKDPNLKVIKARQGEMQVRAFNASPLFAMAKGKMDYNAELAQTLANNLQTLTKLDNGRMWPKGTGNDAYPDKTDSKPEIWSTYPKVAKAAKRYNQAVNELAAVAGDGLPALRSKIGALGKGCKGCHDDFREKD